MDVSNTSFTSLDTVELMMLPFDNGPVVIDSSSTLRENVAPVAYFVYQATSRAAARAVSTIVKMSMIMMIILVGSRLASRNGPTKLRSQLGGDVSTAG